MLPRNMEFPASTIEKHKLAEKRKRDPRDSLPANATFNEWSVEPTVFTEMLYTPLCEVP